MMVRDFAEVLTQTALKHMLDHAERADKFARMVYELILAQDIQPDINQYLEELRAQGYLDDNYEWVPDEEYDDGE